MRRCYGTALLGYAHRGTRPLGVGFEAHQPHNYAEPLITNRGLRWADPGELCGGDERRRRASARPSTVRTAGSSFTEDDE